MGAFVKSVLRELELHCRNMAVAPRTIYLGGGTPTALSETHLATLLTGLKATAAATGTVLEEFSLEANPKTVSASKARLLRDLGVSRVSLGVQAWDEPTLKLLGRDHAPDEAVETFHILRDAGIPSLNVDLMFSIPGQSLKVWNAGLEKTLSLGSNHVSCYNLTYEEDTEFLSQLQAGVLDTDEDRDADHFQSTMDILEAAGFEHYEISNYARPGHRSLHNQAYWRGADYLGLGPSASSTVKRVRWKNIPDTAGYIRLLQEDRLPIVESEELTDRQWLIERVALELRTAEGMRRDRVASSQTDALQMLIAEGLILVTADRVQLTRTGKALSDRIAEQLLPDE